MGKKRISKRNVKNVRKRDESVWRESVNYLVESKGYIYITIAVFFVSFLLGFAFVDQLGFLDKLLEDLVEQTAGLDGLGLTLFILQNNAKSAFFAMILGIVMGIFPLINAVSNGAILGYVYHKASALGGFNIIWMLVPHGIFELPAIFISIGLGIKFGMFIFARDVKKEFFERFRKSMQVFLLIVLPLLIIAAIIEGVLITYY